MKQRVITGVALVVLLIAVLALGTPFVEIAVGFLAVVGIAELFNAAGLSKSKILLVTSMLATVCLVAVQCLEGYSVNPVIYGYIVVLFVLYMANRSKIGLRDISKAFFLTVYVAFLFAHIILVRNMDYGHFLIWLILIGAFVTDTAALFAGKFFGRHKLCPKLSPKKTIEGSIGGVVGSVLGTLIFCLICRFGFGLDTNFPWAVAVGFGASVISQLGDLSASCIKREFGIKDYGKLMPGHGGVMDRFDSLIFVAPFVYYMLLIYPIF